METIIILDKNKDCIINLFIRDEARPGLYLAQLNGDTIYLTQKQIDAFRLLDISYNSPPEQLPA